MFDLFAFIALTSSLLAAEATAQPVQPSPEQIERMREIYLPSASHAALEKLTGTWNVTFEYSSGQPEPLRATGRATNRMVLGGRFVLSEARAAQQDGDFSSEAIFVFGFDGRSREYTVIVLDTFGTYYVTAQGAAGPSKDTLVMSGRTIEGKGTKEFDVILRWIDDDTYRTEIVFRFPDRPPVAAVAATHRRARAASEP